MASDSRSPAVPAGGPSPASPGARRGAPRRASGPGSGAESPSSRDTGRGRKGGRPLARHAPHVRGAPGAKPFVDDLLLGRGFVRSRAAPSLRSIESQPSTQGFVAPGRPAARARPGAAAAAAAGAPDETAEALGSADEELSAKLLRRADLNQGIGEPQSPSRRVFNPYTEFKEFSRKQIKDMEKMFKEYDAGRDGFIDLMELKLMMEKLGAPQTHLGLKNMIKEVDEDFDSKLSFREFLLIFRKAAAGELQEDSGLHVLARLSEIDVSTEGVKGAKSFFEAKVQAMNVSSRFEEEIKAEQEERKKQAEEMKQRKAAFKELQSTFK